MRRCIKEPIPEIFSAWKAMSAAVDEHLMGNYTRAEELFQQADSPVVWKWLNPAWVQVSSNVVEHRPAGDSPIVPKAERDPDRNIAREIRAAVLQRDGYRCRYCGIPVVEADIRKIAAKLYPSAVGWDSRDPSKQHAGFQCLWLQFDHVEPHSHGGRSTTENVVVSCALCNFGKDRFTLRQLNLEDPRLREPEPMDYDGLERLRAGVTSARANTTKKTPTSQAAGSDRLYMGMVHCFLPGAWISAGYLNTEPIDGKKRWFRLDDNVRAKRAVRNGIEGCVLTCRPELLIRRGIDIDRLLDCSNSDQK